jgi:hypothetical protein
MLVSSLSHWLQVDEGRPNNVVLKVSLGIDGYTIYSPNTSLLPRTVVLFHSLSFHTNSYYISKTNNREKSLLCSKACKFPGTINQTGML